jgi:hypothetical protein
MTFVGIYAEKETTSIFQTQSFLDHDLVAIGYSGQLFQPMTG